MANINFKNPTEGALYLFERGFKVFPVKGKVPALKGWQKWAASATEKKIRNYGVANSPNWGVLCDDLVVIDIDNKSGKKGSENFAKLLKREQKTLPGTFAVQTPTGGIHVYFKGESRNSVGALADDVDVRGTGGYVVAPGSRIGEKEYEIIKTEEVADIPDWLLLQLNAKSIKEPLVLDSNTAVPEGTRDDTITRLAGAMRRHGFEYEDILAAMVTTNERICEPPLDKESLERICASVSKYAPEIIEAVEDFAALEQSEAGPIKLSDLKGTPPEREWVIKDWFPVGEISSLYGPGGAGKSLLMLQLLLSIASGTPFLGLKVDKSMQCLGIFCEDSQDELHRRLYSIREAPEFAFMGDAEIPLLLWPRVGMVNDMARISAQGNDVVTGPFRHMLEAQLLSMPRGPKFVVLDTLSDVYLGDENVREKVNKFIKGHIGSLVKDFELTVLLLAHPSRTGQNTGDMLSGSTAWNNSVRNRLALFAHKSFPDIMVLKRMKANYAKEGEEVFVQWEAGRFRLADIALVAEAAASEEHKDMAAAVIGYMAADDRRPINQLARDIKADESVSHLFAGRGISTLERNIQTVFEFPVAESGRLYWYEEAKVPDSSVKRWLMSKADDRPPEIRAEAHEAEKMKEILG